jgi:hypothetical protein
MKRRIAMQKLITENPTAQNTSIINKRIRTTNYIVGVHFSTTDKEHIRDKVLRLIKNDMNKKRTQNSQQ